MAFYADIDIYVQEDGTVRFTGETDHDMLRGESEGFTSKHGRYWLLNISSDETFEAYTYRLHFPGGAKLNYVKTPKMNSIESSTITGSGHDTRFFILVQYSYTRQHVQLAFLGAMLTCMITAIAIWYAWRKRPAEIIGLTSRQKDIVNLLRKHRRLNQEKLARLLRLPKSSISRNIVSLERRGIVERTKEGMSNLIQLVPKGSGKFRQR